MSTEGTVPTQGTKLYVIDTITDPETPEIVKMECPTGITGVGGGAKDQTETTCLDTMVDKTFRGGLGNPAAISVPFNMIPRADSHKRLFNWKASGAPMNWLIVLNDSVDDPGNENFVATIDTEDVFDVPDDRSSIAFSGYVAEVNIDIATNEIIRGTLTIQRSGVESFFGFDPEA